MLPFCISFLLCPKVFNMKNRGHIFVITYFLFNFSDGTLLIDFLKSKHIQYVTFIDCDDYLTNIKLYNSIRHVSILANICSIDTYCNIPENHSKTAFYLDTNCENWNKVVRDMSERKMFTSSYYWLLKTSNYSAVVRELSNIPLSVDGEITVAAEAPNTRFDLYDIYNSGYYNYGTFNSSKIGYWSKHTGVVSTKQWKYVRRANMTGVVLKCMIVVTRKLKNERFEDYIERPELTHIDSMNRFNYALLLHLKDMYNFSYSMMRTNSWGYLHNGTFDGMVGFLQRQQADIGGSPIFFRLERAKVIDYTIQTWISRPCFIFRHPKQIGSFYNIYTRPLNNTVWFCALALFAIIAITLRCLIQQNKTKNMEKYADTTWSYSVLAVLSAVCQQGITLEQNSAAIRLVVFMVFMFALTMYQFYAASITSSLLMKPPRNIRTLEDLLRSPLRAGIEDIVYNIDYFARTTDPVALQLYQKKILTPKGKNFFSPAEGLAMVKSGGFAFHVDIATAYKIIKETFSEREVCELVEVQLFPPQRMVAIVQKGSPYRKLVTYGLRRIAETGLMHRQKLVWHEPKPRCVNTPDSSVFSVSIYEFSMALLLLLSGMVLSLIVLIVEIIVHGHSPMCCKISTKACKRREEKVIVVSPKTSWQLIN